MIFLINGYSIKKINNEDVLFIYVDFYSEFAIIDKENTTKLKNKIKQYIKNNKISFKGSLITLVAGGVMIGTISLNQPKKNVTSNINCSKIVAMMNEVNVLDNQDVYNNIEIINDKIEDTKLEQEVVEEEIHNKNNYQVETKTNMATQKDNIISEDDSNIEEETRTDIDNNIYVALHKKNGTVETIELEDYVIGVIGAEMPASFNIEALKAQAVVARTYAVNIIKSNKTLTDNNSTQNYKSNNELMSMWGSSYNLYYEKIKNAVYDTKGLYITYNGSIIDAVYHSTSNGKTEDSIYVWGNSIPYLKSVESTYDSTNKNYLSTVFFSYEDLTNKLNNIVDINTELNIIERNESGRIVTIDINGITYSGVKIRSLLGLRSTDFDIEKTDTGIKFTTRGYGHGVGMSQYGANGMANNGSSYKDILLHYYNGVTINSL